MARTSLVLGLLAALACGREPRVHRVTVKAMAFDPATLSVAAGDVVEWVNEDFFPHTATATGSFDSGSIASQASWRWEAKGKGRHDYVCTLHPTMKGRLVVR
jgi:plastocyanin